MFEIVQCKAKKYASVAEDAVFKELDKVVSCQLVLEVQGNPSVDDA